MTALGLRCAGDLARDGFAIDHHLQYVTISEDSGPVKISEAVICNSGIDHLENRAGEAE